MIWLTNQAQTTAAVAALNASTILTPNLHEVLSFGSANFPFPDPTVDPAVPNIVVVMNNGVNFEPSGGTTYAEHGGFGENETHVPLLIFKSWVDWCDGYPDCFNQADCADGAYAVGP